MTMADDELKKIVERHIEELEAAIAIAGGRLQVVDVVFTRPNGMVDSVLGMGEQLFTEKSGATVLAYMYAAKEELADRVARDVRKARDAT